MSWKLQNNTNDLEITEQYDLNKDQVMVGSKSETQMGKGDYTIKLFQYWSTDDLKSDIHSIINSPP